jgi:predicted short-subunit dehydrogenase-like oxidoreductase (DUF2520 family)
MKVSVVGAGRMGTGVAVLLQRAGHRIVAVAGRGPTRDRAASYLPGVPVLDATEAARAAELVIVGVPDDVIEAVVASITSGGGFREQQWAMHLSGATGLDVLDAARDAGARRLGVHPLQTVPDVAGAIERIPGSAIAVTADDEEGYHLGERLADDLLGEPFRLADELRPLYHAAAVFASNYMVATSGVASDLFAAAGLSDPVSAMGPLQRATLENIERLGPAQALTGPAARGDATTIERNLAALAVAAPGAIPAYVTMARVALALAERDGRLPAERRVAVDEVLDRWS